MFLCLNVHKTKFVHKHSKRSIVIWHTQFLIENDKTISYMSLYWYCPLEIVCMFILFWLKV